RRRTRGCGGGGPGPTAGTIRGRRCGGGGRAERRGAGRAAIRGPILLLVVGGVVCFDVVVVDQAQPRVVVALGRALGGVALLAPLGHDVRDRDRQVVERDHRRRHQDLRQHVRRRREDRAD